MFHIFVNFINLRIYFRYLLTPQKEQDPDELDLVTKPTTASLPPSTSPNDLKMGVASFCKAFPWHFVMDSRLEFVQLGNGFMRLFGCILATHGAAVSTYFRFHRPRGIPLSIPEIVKRANTPFVLVIRKPAGVEEFPAEVSGF